MNAQERKERPVATGVIDYFPDALMAVANCSWVGNEQHNPGTPLHWDRGKSQDEADALIRHFLERGTIDSDGVRHTAKVAWRALAMLQKEIEYDARAGSDNDCGQSTEASEDRDDAGRCSDCPAGNRYLDATGTPTGVRRGRDQ